MSHPHAKSASYGVLSENPSSPYRSPSTSIGCV